MADTIYTKQIRYFSNYEPIDLITDSETVISVINQQLSPFISSFEGDPSSNLSIHAYHKPPSNEHIYMVGNGVEITIDASLYKDQSSGGKRYNINSNEYIIRIDKTGTYLHFNRNLSWIKIFNEKIDCLTKDILRLIKSMVSLQSEMKGAIMIHASGVVLRTGETVLLLGDSRNGKTTILLEVLSKFYGAMLSCDTSIIKRENEDLVVRGWPSNFSVSFGTMHDYPVLHGFLDANKRKITYTEAWNIYDKHVLDSKEVIKRMGREILPESRVGTLICLNFNTKAETGIYPLNNKKEIIDWLKKVYLGSRDPLYPNWHQFWEVSEDQIEKNIETIALQLLKNNIEVYQMNWAPGPEALLRHVNVLEKHNINMQLCRNEIQL